jgi:hypothetical protein
VAIREVKCGHQLVMATLAAALLLVIAAVAGVVGVGWLLLDAFGTEWDYCPNGRDCIAGWKMGLGFTFAALLAGALGFGIRLREGGT